VPFAILSIASFIGGGFESPSGEYLSKRIDRDIRQNEIITLEQ
jgi:hypothetical protein